MIKKSLLTIVLIVASLVAVNAQSHTYRVYAELEESEPIFSTRINVSINYGQSKTSSNNHNILVNEKGHEIKFNSMIDAINYLSQVGWRLSHTFVEPQVSGNSTKYVTRWIIYKDVTNERQITEGFMTKDTYKK